VTNFSKTSAQGWEAVSKVDQGPDTRPDVIPPTSGRPTRRKAEDITEARRLRDEILALVEKKPRTEADLIRLTGRSKGEVKAALRRLAVAGLVFSKDGKGWHAPALWHRWPTVVAELRANYFRSVFV
jgi:predicted Rossmann fold nucleotide-binding protein DprA/Smf involved in DNA uptake